MLSREACERRVYRLATLLTGNPIAATRVIAGVVDAQPDLRRLDNARMDRLTVLRSREITASELADELVPRRVARALGALPAQQREAWIFARLYQLEPREAARAMDCSVTACTQHLNLADQAMRGAEPNIAAAADALLRYSMTLDVPRFYRVRRERRRRVRRVALLVLAVLVLGLLVVGLRWLLSVPTVEPASPTGDAATMLESCPTAPPPTASSFRLASSRSWPSRSSSRRC
ncbi:MAG: sigma factor-like helix-turn-helix DNA-binding protein [Planctomycetota bacterium]|jgi:hypothetical protein